MKPFSTPEAQFKNKGQLNPNNYCILSPRKGQLKMTLHIKYKSTRSCDFLEEAFLRFS